MALQTTNIRFTNVQGKQTETETVQFQRPVISAQTAVRGFNFDFRTGDHHIDNVQVATAVRRTGPLDVEVEAPCSTPTRTSRTITAPTSMS